MIRSFPILSLALSLSVFAAVPAHADPSNFGTPTAKLADEELARVTGKFLLPNGVELALTVTSDTVVNGQLLLRTVLTVDKASMLTVLGRQSNSSGGAYTGSNGPGVSPGGITISLDRGSGLQTVTPAVSVSSGPAVSVGGGDGAVQSAESLGLVALPLVPGGPAIASADGVVSLDALRNGSRVTFAGDQLGIVNQVGQSIATAVVNSADNRTIDTVTNVTIDTRNIASYQAGMAQLRVDAVVIDAVRGLVH